MTKNTDIVALLPMKANSERVPGKNFKPFAGKPLFRWTLEALLSLPEITRVVINTDARAILNSHGLFDSERVLIRDRKQLLCGDFVSMNAILEDDISTVPADLYLMTHTTNPLLKPETIRMAITRYDTARPHDGADSLFTVTRTQTRFYRADGSPVNHDPQNLVRTQDLEPWFEENSNLYIFTPESFALTNSRIGRKPVLFEVPKLEAIDIDEPDDWFMAETLANALGATQDAD
jgi:CMP-N-acetylneuraminic acid synthetase